MSSKYVVRPVTGEAEWEQALARHPLRNVYSSWGWGAYKERIGWEVVRLLVLDGSGTEIALALVQIKRKLGLRYAYCQGGPLFFLDDEDVASEVTHSILDHLKLRSFDFALVNPYAFKTDRMVMGLLSAGLVPVLARQNHSLLVDLRSGLEAAEKALSGNWRRNLRRSLRGGNLTRRFVDDVEERKRCIDTFAELYEKLTQRKSFRDGLNAPAIRDVMANDPRYVILEIKDKGEITAIRIAHTSPVMMTDFYAASADSAKTNYANYLAVWSFVEYAAEHGYPLFDCGGIDPFGNRGVYNFKRGISHALVQTGPQWLYCRNRLVRNAVAAALSRS